MHKKWVIGLVIAGVLGAGVYWFAFRKPALSPAQKFQRQIQFTELEQQAAEIDRELSGV